MMGQLLNDRKNRHSRMLLQAAGSLQATYTSLLTADTLLIALTTLSSVGKRTLRWLVLVLLEIFGLFLLYVVAAGAYLWVKLTLFNS